MIPEHVDAHARPPSSLRVLFKKWQKRSSECLTNDEAVLDTVTLDQSPVAEEVFIPDTSLAKIKEGLENFNPVCSVLHRISDIRCFELKSLPGAKPSHT